MEQTTPAETPPKRAAAAAKYVREFMQNGKKRKRQQHANTESTRDGTSKPQIRFCEWEGLGSHAVGSSAAHAAAAADVAPRRMLETTHIVDDYDTEAQRSILASSKRVQHTTCSEDMSSDDDIVVHLRICDNHGRQPHPDNALDMEDSDETDTDMVHAEEENLYQQTADGDDGLTVPHLQPPASKRNGNMSSMKYHMQAAHSSIPVTRHDVGEFNVTCSHCGAHHWKLEAVGGQGNDKFRCCGKNGEGAWQPGQPACCVQQTRSFFEI